MEPPDACHLSSPRVHAGSYSSGLPVPARVTRRRPHRTLAALLEIAAILAYGYWGWAVHAGPGRYAWSLGAMVAAWILWDVFRVPGDGSVNPAVPVPGWVRLVIEAAYFTGVATALAAAGVPQLGLAYAILVAILYTLTHQRVIWLLREGAGD